MNYPTLFVFMNLTLTTRWYVDWLMSKVNYQELLSSSKVSYQETKQNFRSFLQVACSIQQFLDSWVHDVTAGRGPDLVGLRCWSYGFIHDIDSIYIWDWFYCLCKIFRLEIYDFGGYRLSTIIGQDRLAGDVIFCCQNNGVVKL